jgi:transcriptional regulator with XRE-family HTH domain
MTRKKELITQSEFARRMGVNKSQVTRAKARGRIELDRKTGLIDWLTQKDRWEDNRSDSLSGSGKANNQKTSLERGLPAVGDIPPVEDVEGIDDIQDEVARSVDAQKPVDDEGKIPKKNTIAYQDWRERKARADRLEAKLKVEIGELIPKNEVIGVILATLGGLKNGVKALPNRTALDIWGIVKEWCIKNDAPINDDASADLQTEIKNILEKETNTILTDIQTQKKALDKEAEEIAKKSKTAEK